MRAIGTDKLAAPPRMHPQLGNPKRYTPPKNDIGHGTPYIPDKKRASLSGLHQSS